MRELPLTRQSLLDRLADQCDESWAEFLSIYGVAVYDYCRSRGLQDSDSNDVCQEVLVAVEKHLVERRHDSQKGKFRSWMFRVAHNITINHVKAKARTVGGSGDSRVASELAEIPAPDIIQSTVIQLGYRRHLFHWAAKKVRPHATESSWQAFWKTAVNGEEPKQVALDLKMKAGAVYTARCRVIERIRVAISEIQGELAEDGQEAEPTPDTK